MTPRRFFHALAAALALAAPAKANPADTDPEIQRTIASAALGSAEIAVVVMDPDSRRVISEHNPNTPLIPASNMKLFTAGTALAILGEDFAFTTTLSALPTDDPARPALLITGSGDPGFADPELLREMNLGVDELIQVWADAAADYATTINADGFSEIILDDRVFDRETVHPSWPRDALNRWYCAEVSGLNFHTNIVELYTERRAQDDPPIVRLVPDLPGVVVRNRARSVLEGRQTAWAARELGTNNLTLFGNVRRTGGPINVALTDSSSLFARYLAGMIETRGIPVGHARRARDTEVFHAAVPLHVIRTPLTTALVRCNADSYNLYAEALLKRTANEVTGAPGSWARGAAVVEMTVQNRLDLAGASSLRIVDGSGMSRDNRATALAIAEWLSVLAADPGIAPAFTASLATESRGTRAVRRLARNDLRNRLFAKSGYLRGTYALSGYLIDEASGDRVVFAMMVNNKPAAVPAKRVHDLFARVVGLADQWLEDTETHTPAMGG